MSTSEAESYVHCNCPVPWADGVNHQPSCPRSANAEMPWIKAERISGARLTELIGRQGLMCAPTSTMREDAVKALMELLDRRAAEGSQ